MNIVSWNPIQELELMSERLNRLINRSSIHPGESGREVAAPDWWPAVDVAETDKEFLIKVDLPEVKKEEVKVWVENGNLLIEGKRKQVKEEEGKKFHRIERSSGTFMRSFSIPENVDQEHLDADFKEGVLSIHLPKSAKGKPKAIEVQVH